MAFVTVTQAEKITGKSRQTLWRDTKSGKLSSKKDEDGNNTYDPSELARVYGNVERKDSTKKLQDETTGNEALLRREIHFLQEKITLLEQSLTESKDREHRAEEREKYLSVKLDKAQSTIDKQTLLISAKSENVHNKPIESRKGILATLLRKNQ